jgi:hypothetical protein
VIALWVLLWTVPASDAAWNLQDNREGVVLETRDVPGSPFEEIRVTTVNAASVERVCEAVWGGNLKTSEPGFKVRRTLQETPEERWTYERVTAPLARDRDYTIHVRRESKPDGCRVLFETQNEKGPPPQPGAVRVPAIRGTWDITQTPEGPTRVVYVVYAEPGGRVPAFLARGSQRQSAVSWLKVILSRAHATLEPHAGP